MQKILLLKILAIGFLSLLLLVPLAMIEGQIQSRSQKQTEVIRGIAESSAGRQTLVGPVFALQLRERVTQTQRDESTGKETTRAQIIHSTEWIAPDQLTIEGTLGVETLKRGLYKALVYHLNAKIQGDVRIPARRSPSTRDVLGARLYLVMGLSDPRGISNDPEILINGQSKKFSPGTGGTLPAPGVHVPLGELDLQTDTSLSFTLPLSLQGLESLAIAPTALSTRVSLTSNWPHPSFQGRFLPQSRKVGSGQFEADWQISHLSRDFDRALHANENTAANETLGVNLIEPVNVYLKSERAIKYGALFVVLTFAAFFLTEITRATPIHPMQYLLVGLALAVFFLLVIALSEHIEFGYAYLVSAVACIALIAVYIRGVLREVRAGVAFAGGLSLLYAVLYGVLQSEDNALLMGSVMLFVALSCTMLITRRFDWYKLQAVNS